ncbi:MAG: patatin-like phospholipase family protein, partial [Nocardioidaceae bacterium]
MTRALVLGGGGITGIAWEIGLLVGLREAGVDLAEPDVVIGTSAGSVVGAQLCSDLSPEEMYGHQVADPDGEVATVFGRTTLLAYAGLLLVPGGEVRRRSRLGRASI